MIKDFGHFTRYTPTPDHPFYIPGGAYFRNDAGEDFLTDIVLKQAQYDNGAMTGEAAFPHYASIYQGRVFYVTSDPMRIVPSDMTVIGSTDPINVGDVWDGTALSAPAVDLVAYAATKRWEVETGGITVNGVQIDTSRESQNMITGAYNWSNANPTAPIKFKAASGWVEIDNATMVAIADAVGNHVQAAFDKESEVAAAIAAGTITTTAQIDAAFAAL